MARGVLIGDMAYDRSYETLPSCLLGRIVRTNYGCCRGKGGCGLFVVLTAQVLEGRAGSYEVNISLISAVAPMMHFAALSTFRGAYGLSEGSRRVVSRRCLVLGYAVARRS